MKRKILIAAVLFVALLTNGFSQEKSKKQLKAEKKIAQQQLVDSLMQVKEFEFTGTTAYPQGGKSVNLTTNSNFIKFNPELIDGDMPFFGRAYAGAGYGGDGGLKFKEKPQTFTIEKNKKEYTVTAVVKGANDTYKISLSVGFEGNARLTINSNNRSTISYNGNISKIISAGR